MRVMAQPLPHHLLQPEAYQPMPRTQPRLGPRPFGQHLMTALNVWLSLPLVWPSLKNASPGWNPEAQARLQRLGGLWNNPSDPVFIEALGQEAVARSRAFLAGVRAYRAHPARRDLVDMPVVWQSGTTLVRDYNPGQPDAPVVLVIPSLVNRFEVLDLDGSCSFLRAMAAQGLRPIVIDWDAPGPEEKEFGLAEYVTQRLLPVLDIVTGQDDRRARRGPSSIRPPLAQRTPQPDCHVLGYCMGGLLALAAAALRPHQVRTLCLLATPWDFHRPDPSVGLQFMELIERLEPCLQSTGVLSVDALQSLLTGFQPLQMLAKFAHFARMDPVSDAARHFVLLEDWLNDGVPLAAPVARECFRGWYGENRTARFQWRVGERVIDPRAMTMPSYAIVPGRDRIVPPESALPLAALLPRSFLHEPMTGHIGMMTSRSAARTVWTPFWRWLKDHA